MKKAVVFFVVLIALSLAGCSDDSYSVVDVQIEIVITKADGTDLLDPATPGHFEPSDFKLYYVKNGVPEIYFEGNLELQHGFQLKKSDVTGKNVLEILPNHSENEERITLLEIEGVRTDRIKTAIMPNRGNNTTVGKVWLNDDLVWDNESRTPRQIELILE